MRTSPEGVPRASVLIPCHDKQQTLPLTVDTVLRQTVTDLEVLLIGDGVTDAVRATIHDLCAADDRVRFLDNPKGPHHGEVYRHHAILAARSEAICYLCDDDLLLPEHVADLVDLLQDASFVQSLNGFVRPDGTVGTYPADLADPDSIKAILSDRIRFNAVSITGTAHRRSFYLEAGASWETTPQGRWPDHHQWRRMLRDPGFRGATSQRMTAIQLPTSQGGRHRWTQAERLAELERWHAVVTQPDGQVYVDELYRRAAIRELVVLRPRVLRMRRRLRRLRRRLARAEHAANRPIAGKSPGKRRLRLTGRGR